MSETEKPEKKQHIRAVIVDGWWYHCYVFRGSTILLSRAGRVGDCLRL